MQLSGNSASQTIVVANAHLVGNSASQTVVVAASNNHLSGNSGSQTVVVASSNNHLSGNSASQTIVVAAPRQRSGNSAPQTIAVTTTAFFSPGNSPSLLGTCISAGGISGSAFYGRPYQPLPAIIIQSAAVALLTPQVLRGVVNAGSTLRFAVSFQDDDYDAIFPDSIAWSLLDLDRRSTITAGTVAVPADDSIIRISPQYNPMRTTYGSQAGRRALVITGNYNDSDAITAECLFSVRSFQ